MTDYHDYLQIMPDAYFVCTYNIHAGCSCARRRVCILLQRWQDRYDLPRMTFKPVFFYKKAAVHYFFAMGVHFAFLSRVHLFHSHQSELLPVSGLFFVQYNLNGGCETRRLLAKFMSFVLKQR